MERVKSGGGDGDEQSGHEELETGKTAVSEIRKSFGSRRNSMSGRRSSGSLRSSLSFPRGGAVASQLLEDIQSEIVAQAGDAGDRVIEDGRLSASSGSLRFELDDLRSLESGVHPLPDDALIVSNGHWRRDPNLINYLSPVSPLPAEIVSPFATDPILYARDRNRSKSDAQKQPIKDNQEIVPQKLLYISCVTHLAVFGILGVFARYLLQKLFGPNVAAVTSDQSPLYPDLPANMVGSFLMGWMGVVFKGDLSKVSDFLVIGLTTGFLGSLTTFSGWMQKMLDLSATGHWVYAAVGLLLGMMLADMSIILGVESAKGARWLLSRYGYLNEVKWKVDSYRRHIIALLVMLTVLALLWGVSGELLRTRLKGDRTSAQLWLACMVGPIGVWVRWRLARMNGLGLGKNGSFKWVPFGTLAANVLAACIMAALATIKKAVDTRRCDIVVNGIQMGLLGCLSTVSTFAAELYAMRHSNHPWRAHVYAAITIVPSFILGTLIYSLPVWVKDYN